jgi:hypothetical protein
MLGQFDQQGSAYVSPGSIMIAGTGSLCRDEYIRFSPVCFCDIPEESLGRHITIYGRFGLAFKKEFLVAKGANPVFYIAKKSLVHYDRPSVPPLTEEDLKANSGEALKKHFGALAAGQIPVRRCEFFDCLAADLRKVLLPPWTTTPADAIDPDHMQIFFNLMLHVFAFMKFFDESLPEENPENYYMEREWRVADSVSFDLGDVQRVYVAPGFRDRIESEFPGLNVQELS